MFCQASDFGPNHHFGVIRDAAFHLDSCHRVSEWFCRISLIISIHCAPHNTLHFNPYGTDTNTLFITGKFDSGFLFNVLEINGNITHIFNELLVHNIISIFEQYIMLYVFLRLLHTFIVLYYWFLNVI